MYPEYHGCKGRGIWVFWNSWVIFVAFVLSKYHLIIIYWQHWLQHLHAEKNNNKIHMCREDENSRKDKHQILFFNERSIYVYNLICSFCKDKGCSVNPCLWFFGICNEATISKWTRYSNSTFFLWNCAACLYHYSCTVAHNHFCFYLYFLYSQVISLRVWRMKQTINGSRNTRGVFSNHIGL